MNRPRIKLLVCASVLASVSLTSCSFDANKIAEGEVTTWKCGKGKSNKDSYSYVPYEYIIQSPGDILAISGSGNDRSSIILHTNDSDQSLPVSWVLADRYSFKSTDDRGFAITGSVEGYDGNPIKQALILNGRTGKLFVKDGLTTSNLECTPIGDWKEKINLVKKGPGMEYLEQRLSSLPLFRKKTGDPNFNSKLAKEASGNDDYKSVYELLSPLKSSELSKQDMDLSESAKNKLIENSSNSYNAWEWTGGFTWTGSVGLTTEEMREYCRSFSSSPSTEGYQIESSTPQDKIVYSGVTCHGTLHLLKKEGSIQAEKPLLLFSHALID